MTGIQDLEGSFKKLTRYYRNSILPKAPDSLKISHEPDIETYYELNRKTYNRQGVPVPFSFEVLKSNWKALHQNEAGKIFFVIDTAERVHAAALLAWDEQRAWYHSAGGDPELRNSGAGIYLVWEMIRYASEVLKLDVFDFAGSMIPGIEKVWKNFGGERKYYYHLEHHFSPFFPATQKILKLFKRN